MKVNVGETRRVDVKTLDVHAHVCDSGTYTLYDTDGKQVAERDDYVPKFFPGQHFGDDIILKIDIETGQILNWKVPTEDQLDEAFELSLQAEAGAE